MANSLSRILLVPTTWTAHCSPPTLTCTVQKRKNQRGSGVSYTNTVGTTTRTQSSSTQKLPTTMNQQVNPLLAVLQSHAILPSQLNVLPPRHNNPLHAPKVYLHLAVFLMTWRAYSITNPVLFVSTLHHLMLNSNLHQHSVLTMKDTCEYATRTWNE